MIRLGLFGGTFDPVHYGHLRTVEAARIELGLPRVLMLPNPHPPHKSNAPLTEYRHRKEMLRLALREFPSLVISDFEEGAEGPAYTSDTVRRVIASLPEEEKELWLIMGADSFIELPHWKDPETLLRAVQVAVLPRPGCNLHQVDASWLARVRILDTPQLDISASDIRDRIRKGLDVSALVPPGVMGYIREFGLYGAGLTKLQQHTR